MSDKRTIDTDIAMIVDLWSMLVISSDLELLNISHPSKLCLIFSLFFSIRIQSELFHSVNESDWATKMSTKYLCFVQVPFWGELIKCDSVDKFPMVNNRSNWTSLDAIPAFFSRKSEYSSKIWWLLKLLLVGSHFEFFRAQNEISEQNLTDKKNVMLQSCMT